MRSHLPSDSYRLLEQVSFHDWIHDPSLIHQLTSIASQTLAAFTSSWGLFSGPYSSLEVFEAASEVLEANCRGYFPKTAKYYAQASYLLHQKDSSLRSLGLERLGRVFSEALPYEVSEYTEKIENLLEDSAVDCLRVLLHGTLQLTVEMCLDDEYGDLLEAQSIHNQLIQGIENRIFAVFQSAVEKNNIEVIPVICELGSESLRIRIYEWIIQTHPQLFTKFPMSSEVEKYLLYHDYMVDTTNHPLSIASPFLLHCTRETSIWSHSSL